MTHRFKTALLAAAVATGLFSAPVSAQSPDTVVATVEGTEITLAELIAIHQSLPEQLRNAPFPALYPQLRERAIDSVLLLKAAEANDLAEDEEVQQRVDDARNRIMQQVFIEQAVAEAVTEEAVRERYEAIYADREGPTEVRARHILVETEEEANAIIDRLDDGAVFADLAREVSTGPSSANGGDLGYFEKERMVPEFAEAAFSQQVGTYTKSPVQTQFGWHVILVEDKRQQPAPPLDQVRGEIETALSRDAINAVVDGLRADKEIQLFGIDGAPEPAE